MVFENSIVTVNYHNYGHPTDVRIELKPCPFCGSSVELAINDWDARVDMYRAECPKCGAINRNWRLDPAMAAREWNNRALYNDVVPPEKPGYGDDDDDYL